MTPEQMDSLRDFSERAAKLPSYGNATAFSALNMHSEPNRQSPSFYQIAEGTAVDLIGHKVSPRLPGTQMTPQTPLVKLQPPPPKKKKKEEEKKESKIPPPPRPAPPKLPPNYDALSKTNLDDDEDGKPEPPKKDEVPEVKAPLEDWSLVRTKDGKAGWVLSRMISMSIPDEVAQYAEGARITSYFALADVQDDELGLRHNWLWTTNSGNAVDYDFDSFRVFIWSRKKHRYETGYIERRIEGYYPVEAKKGTDPVFSLITRGDDGKTYRKTYAFSGYRVTVTKKEPFEPLQLPTTAPATKPLAVESASPTTAPQEKRSWKDRIKALFSSGR